MQCVFCFAGNFVEMEVMDAREGVRMMMIITNNLKPLTIIFTDLDSDWYNTFIFQYISI